MASRVLYRLVYQLAEGAIDYSMVNVNHHTFKFYSIKAVWVYSLIGDEVITARGKGPAS